MMFAITKVPTTPCSSPIPPPQLRDAAGVTVQHLQVLPGKGLLVTSLSAHGFWGVALLYHAANQKTLDSNQDHAPQLGFVQELLLLDNPVTPLRPFIHHPWRQPQREDAQYSRAALLLPIREAELIFINVVAILFSYKCKEER